MAGSKGLGLAATAWLLLAATTASPQEQATGRPPAPASLVEPGRPARVSVGGGRVVVGTLLDVDDTFVRLEVDDDVVALPVRDVRSVEVNVAPARRSFMSAAWLPMLAGGILGAALGKEAFDECSQRSGASGMCVMPLVTLPQAGVGLGALVGVLLRGGEPEPQWKPVPLDRVRLSVAPAGRRGVAVALSVSF